MNIIKYTILFVILGVSSYIGVLLSKKYVNRTKELKEMKNALTMLSTQIEFTYEPLPRIFKNISEKFKSNIGNILKKSYENMEEHIASEAWEKAVDNTYTNLNKEDKQIIKNLSNLLRTSRCRWTT